LRPEEWLAIEQKILQSKISGRDFIELTTYRGIALWWFIRYRLYHPVKPSPLVKAMLTHSFFTPMVDFLYDFSTLIFCKLLTVHPKVGTNKKKKGKILVSAQTKQWQSFHDLNGQLKKSDAYFDYLITELKKRNYEVVTVYPIGYSAQGLRIMIYRLIQGGTIHRVFNIYWSIKTWKKAIEAKRFFNKVWKKTLKNDEKLINLLRRYQLGPELEYCFNHILERVVKRIEMAKEMIEREKPDLIMLINEYSPFGLELVAASKLKNVPSLALQHGNLGLGNMYSKGSISEHKDMKTPYCVIPDKTAVFGQYYYDFLTKISAYPPSRVAITGLPRHDILAIAHRIYSRENFCATLKLNPNKRIILVITENVPAPKGEIFLRGALKALKNLADVQIVIKPHPGERGEWYNKIVADENIMVTVLPKDAETFEALYACDLLVAGFSTTITEAIVLGKPVVSFLPKESADFAPHYKEVTLRVHKEDDLVSALNKALFNEKVKAKLKKAGEKFVTEHAYKRDGKATERVANLVEEMLKERESD